jgi:hypothetical protein
MIDHGSGILVATICNTIGDACSHALWVSDGTREYVADLSMHTRGAAGLTGVAYRDERLYVAVQAAETRILTLDLALNVVATVEDDRFRDLHSLRISGAGLYVASPGNGLVLRRDLTTGVTEIVADYGRSAWVADAYVTSDDIWICCHNLSFIAPGALGGGIYSVGRGQVLLDGLGKPHTVLEYRDGFVVLDSLNAEVVFFDLAGTRRVTRLEGFLRGAAVTESGKLLVAGGPHRLVSRKTPGDVIEQGLREAAANRLKIFELTGETPTGVHVPEMPGFEIYDLLILPADVRLTPPEERVVQVEHGMFARFYYSVLMKALAGSRG